jgi:hypothetical protein
MRHVRQTTVVVVLTAAACLGADHTRSAPPGELEALWADLGTKEPVKVDRAMTGLVARPAQTIPLLEQRLRPVPAADPRRLAQLLAALDSDEFTVRDRATHELAQLGEVAEPTLVKALGQDPTPEARWRIEGVLDKVKQDRLAPPAERLRLVRAVEVLERIGDAAARRVLAAVARGATEAQLTTEASVALERLTRSTR